MARGARRPGALRRRGAAGRSGPDRGCRCCPYEREASEGRRLQRVGRGTNSGHHDAEPNIPDSSRWKASHRREFYPYVRFIGGVSLFDFHQFEPYSYQAAHPLSNWHEFVPYRKDWSCAVWIEIDRLQVLSNFISGDDLLEKWKLEKAYRHSLMPRIPAFIGSPGIQTPVQIRTAPGRAADCRLFVAQVRHALRFWVCDGLVPSGCRRRRRYQVRREMPSASHGRRAERDLFSYSARLSKQLSSSSSLTETVRGVE
jgi:hypothetical protein